ncbi:MAG: hypothetical protein Q9M92_05095 [Enterobacterales bacterium]|nr:hypothetical protein [Enterobacterales bacterium]
MANSNITTALLIATAAFGSVAIDSQAKAKVDARERVITKPRKGARTGARTQIRTKIDARVKTKIRTLKAQQPKAAKKAKKSNKSKG